MDDEILFLDDLLEKSFFEAYNVARTGCSDDDAAVKIGMGIDGILRIINDYGQQNIEVLKAYKGVFSRIVHADVYAALLEGAITLDPEFVLPFDEKITDGNYDNMLTSYFVDLLKHYVQALHVKADINLSADNLALVRQVCPWYNLGGRK